MQVKNIQILEKEGDCIGGSNEHMAELKKGKTGGKTTTAISGLQDASDKR